MSEVGVAQLRRELKRWIERVHGRIPGRCRAGGASSDTSAAAPGGSPEDAAPAAHPPGLSQSRLDGCAHAAARQRAQPAGTG